MATAALAGSVDAGRAAAGTAVAGVRAAGGLGALVPLVAWWAVDRGGLPVGRAVPGLLWLAGAAVVLALAVPARRPPRAAATGALALAALAVLGAASTTWALAPGAAVDAAVRLALAAGAVGLVVLWPPTAAALRALVLLTPTAAVLGVVAGLAGVGDAAAFVDGRLAAPTGYPNATALLALAGAAVAVVLAADAGRPAALRVASLGAAAALLGAALLPQSRSVLLLGIPAAVAILAAAPGRARAAAAGALACALTAAAAPALLAVRRSVLDGEDGGAGRALALLAALAAAGAVAGLLALRAERRLPARPPRPTAAVGRRARIVAAVVLVLALVGTGVVAAREVAGGLGDPDYDRIEASGTRFSAGLRSNRPDYWRAAVQAAADAPVRGVGAGSFGPAYLERRTTTGTPEAAHSVWLGTAAGLGLFGLAALLAATIALGAGALGALRRSSGTARATALAAVLPAGLLALDASVDWTARLPLLALLAAGPAAALAALPRTRGHDAAAVDGAAATGTAGTGTAGTGRAGVRARGDGLARVVAAGDRAAAVPAGAAARARPRPAPSIAAPIAMTAALVAAAGLALPGWRAARDTAAATALWPSSPARATALLRDAAALVPRDPRPPLREALLATAAGRDAQAAAALRVVARRDPAGWYAPVALAVLDARAGAPERGLARLRAAGGRVARARLSPRVAAAIRAGRAPDPREVQRLALRAGP